jgi:hypothetical protein
MAQLTIGICIGCCLGIAVMLVTHLLAPADADMKLWLASAYYVVFSGSIAYALWRPPARAAIELLSATAIMTAALPVLNALTTGDHPIRSAADGLWAVFWVDVVAAALAAAFWSISRGVVQRARQAQLPGVWALGTDEETARKDLPA